MHRLDTETMAQITDLRVAGDEDVLDHARRRPRRAGLTEDGRLVILAADHPARMVTAVGEDAIAMGDRADYLGRIVRVLGEGHVDGLMGTPDILEEVLAVDYLSVQRGEDSFLTEKVLVGCMNRGGLAGTAFEMDDTFTAFDAPQMVKMNLDAAKMMFRLDPMDYASGRTIAACARAIDRCVDMGLTVFLEPLPVTFSDGKYAVDNSVESLVKVCGVASGLGRTSWKTWLKLPWGVDYSRVAAATTCPILMLGGPAKGGIAGLLGEFSQGLAAGHNVRGALVGRNVLYPGDLDPAAAAAAVWGIVHEGLSADEARGAVAGD